MSGDFSCQSQIHDDPTHGRVLEVTIAGTHSHEGWMSSRAQLENEISRHCPRYLVIDIRRYSGVCGAAVIGAIVVGAHAMRKLGNVHETRVLATGKSADAMQEWIRVAGLAPLIGEQVYSERASALGPR